MLTKETEGNILTTSRPRELIKVCMSIIGTTGALEITLFSDHQPHFFRSFSSSSSSSVSLEEGLSRTCVGVSP